MPNDSDVSVGVEQGIEHKNSGHQSCFPTSPIPAFYLKIKVLGCCEKHLADCIKRSIKYPQYIMVWGVISATGVSPLCFLKGTVNAAINQEVLDSFLVYVEDHFVYRYFIFQQDLSPPFCKNNKVVH